MAISSFSLLTWLLIGWALFATIFVLLLIYRGVVGMGQEDQLFLTSAGRGFEAESAAATAKIAKLRPWVWGSGLTVAAFSLAVAGVFVLQTMQRW